MWELRLITEALEGGELAHSAVRELCRVAVPKTEDACWAFRTSPLQFLRDPGGAKLDSPAGAAEDRDVRRAVRPRTRDR